LISIISATVLKECINDFVIWELDLDGGISCLLSKLVFIN
jgi:hypothetical protein